MRISARVGVFLASLLISATAAAQKREVSKRRDAETPWAGAIAGVGIPIGGAGGGMGVKLGVKAGVWSFPYLAPDRIEVIVPISFTLGTEKGLEAAVGGEYRKALKLGKLALEAYGDFTVGWSHRWTEQSVQFRGNQTFTTNAFMTRLAGGARYAVTSNIDVYLEPVNFGLYVTSPLGFEYSALAGASFTF